jgi:hypothetical protein
MQVYLLATLCYFFTVPQICVVWILGKKKDYVADRATFFDVMAITKEPFVRQVTCVIEIVHEHAYFL